MSSDTSVRVIRPHVEPIRRLTDGRPGSRLRAGAPKPHNKPRHNSCAVGLTTVRLAYPHTRRPREQQSIGDVLTTKGAAMRLTVDTSNVAFTVTKNPEEKNDQNGKQKFDRDGQPMWTTQVMALDGTGGEVLAVSV